MASVVPCKTQRHNKSLFIAPDTPGAISFAMPNQNQRGTTMIEYALVVALIAVAVIAVESILGSTTFNTIRATANSVDAAASQL